jgi:hypothetical protein
MLVCLLVWATALRLVTSPIPLVPTSGRSHNEARAGCIVSLTTPCDSGLRSPKLGRRATLWEPRA